MTQQQGPDLNAIAPTNGPKFSPNFHQFLSTKRVKASLRLQRVFVDTHKQMWLGYFDDDLFIGARLTQVLCHGAKTQVMAFMKMNDLVEVPDFWAKYQAIGRCAVDAEHRIPFIGDETRWDVQGDHRSCLWCGQVHQRQEQRVTTVVRTEWVSVAPAACTA